MNSNNVTCPGIVMFQVRSNKALANNATLMLQFLSRGQLMTRTLKLEADYSYDIQEYGFNHFWRNWEVKIHCCEGWRGVNCQPPVYDDNEHIKDGKVHFLKILSDSERQKFVDGTLRKAIFKYIATLELDGDFGPTFRAVATVFRGKEMASDFVEIAGLQACSSPAIAWTERKGGLQLDKQYVVPRENVSFSLKILLGEETDDAVETTCLLSMIDVSSKQFNSAIFRRIDLNTFTALLKSNQMYHRKVIVQSTKDAYRAAGMDFVLLSPKSSMYTPRYCPWVFYSTHAPRKIPFLGPIGPMGPPDPGRQNRKESDTSHYQKPTQDTIPLIRDFFPEVWLFETVKLIGGSLTKSLIVPDTLTTWETNAVCITAKKGLWMPIEKPKLTVQMPFFVDFTPPLMARRGEVLHLPVSVFVYPTTTTRSTAITKTTTTITAHKPGISTQRICYEVEVSLETGLRDWRAIGATAFTECICVGDLKQTFLIPIRPLRFGQLNITAKAVAHRNSLACSSDNADFSGLSETREAVTVTDMVRRGVRVIAEGVEKRVTLGGVFCTSKGEPFHTFFPFIFALYFLIINLITWNILFSLSIIPKFIHFAFLSIAYIQINPVMHNNIIHLICLFPFGQIRITMQTGD
ncbi:unnamed protein product [Hydatigera taeniaeformis]|uniref:A2M domain-containing protein n=1 Tax=Hydatigena taeniaeformis TaxID=6205 RepID=A0A0R3XBA0_HYDTA|nr:unnamed protein product [Hydatigera taeniaeformis]